MCREINTEFVLANMLITTRGSVSIRTLKKVRQEIERKVPSVFVDVTSDSITTVVESRPEMFRWADDEVDRAPNADKFFSKQYVNDHINWRVPKNIRSNCLNIIASYQGPQLQHATW